MTNYSGYSQEPNKWGGGLKINEGWEISENLSKWGDGNVLRNLIPGRATNQGSHDMTGHACFGVQFLAGNLAPKMHTCKCKVLAEYLLFLLWPVIHLKN